MPVNQVYKATGEKIMDISDSTVTEVTLTEGFTAYDATGKKITGIAPVSSWGGLQQKVRNNDMADISIGDQYTCKQGSGELTWDVIDKNKDTPANPNLTYALTLRVDSLLPNGLQFDAPEAFYACQSDVLSAGTYYYKYRSTYYYFFLSQSVPVGGQLVCTDNSTLKSYESGSSTTPIETVTVRKGSYGTNLGTLADETRSGNLNTNGRRLYGSNDWKESAKRQWLNSDKPAGQWWTPQNPWDRPPAYAETMNGFMYDLDPEFLGVIGKTQVTTNYFDTTTGAINDTYITEDYFFLMSASQVSSDYSGEGTKYTPYSDNASRIMYKDGSATYYRLRSPSPRQSFDMYHVNSDGSVNAAATLASSNYYVAPACNLI